VLQNCGMVHRRRGEGRESRAKQHCLQEPSMFFSPYKRCYSIRETGTHRDRKPFGQVGVKSSFGARPAI